jgi:flagellar hook-basal body complex protein FliE
MFIDPISPINRIDGFEEIEAPKKNTGAFASLVKSAIGSIQETSEKAAMDMTDVATGLADNPSELLVDSTVATLTTSLVVQLRNKAVDAYNEIIKISV